jgi:hypothetical protein
MEAIQAIVLFVLGVGAAFLAYFAWHHVQFGMERPSNATAAAPGIAMQA